uniref:Uncharacterized protein n=1 Tax=Amphimedon queenslandica TaxID=400682 RepID=A0A1X7V5Y5_AMPQE
MVMIVLIYCHQFLLIDEMIYDLFLDINSTVHLIIHSACTEAQLPVPAHPGLITKQQDTFDLFGLSDEDDPPPLPEPVLLTSNVYSMPPYPNLPYQPAQYLQPKQLLHAYEEDSVSPNSQVLKCYLI